MSTESSVESPTGIPYVQRVTNGRLQTLTDPPPSALTYWFLGRQVDLDSETYGNNRVINNLLSTDDGNLSTTRNPHEPPPRHGKRKPTETKSTDGNRAVSEIRKLVIFKRHFTEECNLYCRGFYVIFLMSWFVLTYHVTLKQLRRLLLLFH